MTGDDQILPIVLRWGVGPLGAAEWWRGRQRSWRADARRPSVSCCATATSPSQIDGED